MRLSANIGGKKTLKSRFLNERLHSEQEFELLRMNVSNLWAISIAEIPTSCRLVWAWVVALVVCIDEWLTLSASNSFFSSTSPAVGLSTPLFQFGNLTAKVLGWDHAWDVRSSLRYSISRL